MKAGDRYQWRRIITEAVQLCKNKSAAPLYKMNIDN